MKWEKTSHKWRVQDTPSNTAEHGKNTHNKTEDK
jgi:hypothetical protein